MIQKYLAGFKQYRPCRLLKMEMFQIAFYQLLCGINVLTLTLHIVSITIENFHTMTATLDKAGLLFLTGETF